MLYRFLFLALLVCQFTFAQNKKFTMEDVVLKQRTTLAPDKLSQLQWLLDCNKYLYTKKDKSIEWIVITDADRNLAPKIIYLSEIKQVLRKEKLDTFSRLPIIENATDELIRLNNAGVIYAYNHVLKNIKCLVQLEKNAENVDTHVKTNKTVYNKNNNLFLLNEGNITQLTTDGTSNICYGKSVHRDEYGISKGTFWSNNGNLLAYYRMDQSMVTDYPIMDLTIRPAQINNIKYPMAGDKSHQVSVAVYNDITKTTNYLKISGDKEQYITNISWSPDDQYIYLILLNRATTFFELNMYNAIDGSFVKTIYRESNAIWLEPLKPIEFLQGSNTQFIFESQVSGHNHIYLMSTENAEVKPITSGNWDVLDVKYLSNDKVYFTSTITSPLDIQFCSTSFKTNKTIQLTEGLGLHTILFNPYNKNFINQHSSLTIPKHITLHFANKNSADTLLKASNPLIEYGMPKLITGKLVNKDGIDLFYKMLLPPQFDSTLKYKSITYVYNGPHVQLVNNGWLAGSDLWQYYMAQQGYIVFCIDGRGSGNRGFDFEKWIHKKLGQYEMEDQLFGNNFLRSKSYIDPYKMGIFGWSFGGFMTTSLMTKASGAYSVGVAGGPVIDWQYYEIMYTERYMDMPSENQDGYQTTSLLNNAEKLKGKLLLIHGTSDDVVVWQHSLSFIKKCVDKNIPIDYFAYPGHLHNVLGKDRVHLMQKVTDYFNQNL